MTDPDKLPALPACKSWGRYAVHGPDGWFDADQMHSYALTSIAVERARADALEAALKTHAECLQLKEQMDHIERIGARDPDTESLLLEDRERLTSLAKDLFAKQKVVDAAARALLEKKT